jgi:hypothetical protein
MPGGDSHRACDNNVRPGKLILKFNYNGSIGSCSYNNRCNGIGDNRCDKDDDGDVNSYCNISCSSSVNYG